MAVLQLLEPELSIMPITINYYQGYLQAMITITEKSQHYNKLEVKVDVNWF